MTWLYRMVLLMMVFGNTLSLSWAEGLSQNLDSLEVRPMLGIPKLSIPTRLTAVPVAAPGEFFVPPLVEDIPNDKYGDMVRWGRNLFVDTQVYGKRYIGNGLTCSNCHLQEGRKPDSAPLWAAYGMYPMYRRKTRSVVSFQQRIQDCFKFSMDGIAPALDAPEMDALVAYAQWISSGAPIRVELPGRGFPSIKILAEPSPERGKIVYQTRCIMCHGKQGLGKKNKNTPGYMFPPLWGYDSFNKGAGMYKINVMARFIKGNMPLGSSYTLSDKEVLDVASYIQIQRRPKDPRISYFKDFFFPDRNN